MAKKMIQRQFGNPHYFRCHYKSKVYDDGSGTFVTKRILKTNVETIVIMENKQEINNKKTVFLKTILGEPSL